MTLDSRLDFEDDLMTGLARSPRGRRRPRLVSCVLAVVLVLAAGLVVSMWHFSRSRAIRAMGRDYLLALQAVAREGDGHAPDTASEDGWVTSIEMRREFTELGVDWQDVRPLAFGGALAEVADRPAGRSTIDALAGAIYFVSAGTVYNIEVSAQRGKSGFEVVRVWHYGRTELAPGEVKPHSRELFREFMREPEVPDSEVVILSARHIFVWL